MDGHRLQPRSGQENSKAVASNQHNHKDSRAAPKLGHSSRNGNSNNLDHNSSNSKDNSGRTYRENSVGSHNNSSSATTNRRTTEDPDDKTI